MKSSDRWALVVTIVAVILGAASAMPGVLAPGLQYLVQIGVILTYGSFIMGLLTLSVARLAEHDAKLERIQEMIAQETLVSLFTSRLIRTHDVIQRIGLGTFASQISSLTGTDKGFMITGINWAMRANTNFWRRLREYNDEISYRGSSEKLECLVVHSGSPRLWSQPDALASLDEQKNLQPMDASSE